MPLGDQVLIEHTSLFEARHALADNVIHHLKQDTHPILRNQNTALLGICHSLERLERNLDLLHNKLQPILRELSDDAQSLRDSVTRR